MAEAAGVRLALHPDDPPVRAIGPTARLFYSVDNLARAFDIAGGSPAFGFDLCLGTVSEMEGGAAAVHDAIERFGPAGAICYIISARCRERCRHFRSASSARAITRPARLSTCYAGLALTATCLTTMYPRWLATRHGDIVPGATIGYIQGLINEPRTATVG